MAVGRGAARSGDEGWTEDPAAGNLDAPRPELARSVTLEGDSQGPWQADPRQEEGATATGPARQRDMGESIPERLFPFALQPGVSP